MVVIAKLISGGGLTMSGADFGVLARCFISSLILCFSFFSFLGRVIDGEDTESNIILSDLTHMTTSPLDLTNY